MAKFNSLKPLAAGVGAALVASTLASAPVNAAENPFATTELAAGYQLADNHEGKCGEGKCGEEKRKAKEGKCGEGKCGEGKKDAKAKEGKCGEGKCGEEKRKAKEGKCGEGKCGK